METLRVKKLQRKKLNIPEEEFFERILLLFGPPTQEYEQYADRYLLGYRNWLKRSENGQKFMALVEGHGEARIRAVGYYIKYKRWYAQQRKTA